MKKPLVSIITVNYDTPKVTAEMLATLKTQNYDNFEIIVVDNASPKFTSEHLKKDFPFIIHISSPKNLGFAGGNNLGLAVAKGEYIFLANNDRFAVDAGIGDRLYRDQFRTATEFPETYFGIYGQSDL